MGHVYDIQTHTAADLNAVAAYERFPKKRRENLLWVYCPISQHDKILAFGVRELEKGGQCILVGIRCHLWAHSD